MVSRDRTQGGQNLIQSTNPPLKLLHYNLAHCTSYHRKAAECPGHFYQLSNYFVCYYVPYIRQLATGEGSVASTMLSVGERTKLLGGSERGGRGYGAQRVSRKDVPTINMVIGDVPRDQNKTVDEYFAAIDRSVKENIKNAEKVSQDILKILPEYEKKNSDTPQELDEDFSSIAANIIVNFQL